MSNSINYDYSKINKTGTRTRSLLLLRSVEVGTNGTEERMDKEPSGMAQAVRGRAAGWSVQAHSNVLQAGGVRLSERTHADAATRRLNAMEEMMRVAGCV
uniref:Uncharacterized protein n=1 Tax=Parascaris univalens TaxID=6257 RepID=A0A915BYB8_PARUN